MNRRNGDIIDMSNDRFIIQDHYIIKTPDDAIFSNSCKYFRNDLYLPPQGSGQINEVWDSTSLIEQSQTPYRYHDRGIKTYFVQKGQISVTLNGGNFILEEGDVINIEPWCPYGFEFLDKGAVWREMYTDMNMLAHRKVCYSIKDRDQAKHLPEPTDCQQVDKRTVLEVTCKGEGKAVFDFEGIRCLLKVGRWQLRGFKEVWEYRIEKGYQLQFNNTSENEGLYMVQKGRFVVEVNGQTLTVAEKEDIINIPAYTPYTLTAISEDCVLYDCNVSAHLFRLLEMIEAARDYFPVKLREKEYMEYLFEVNKMSGFANFINSDL